MSLLNKNFSLDQRVVLTKLSPDLNGRTGSILGCSVSGLVDFYIVLLDNPLPTHKAVHVPEGCIEPAGPGRKMSDYTGDTVGTGATVGWDPDGGRPINPNVLAAASCVDGPRMPQDTRSPGDPAADAPDDEELVRIERDALAGGPVITCRSVLRMVDEIRRLRVANSKLEDDLEELLEQLHSM